MPDSGIAAPLPPVREWRTYGSRWEGDDLSVEATGYSYLLESPGAACAVDTLVVCVLSLTVAGQARFQFGLQSLPNGKWITCRQYDGTGPQTFVAVARIRAGCRYRVVLAQVSRPQSSALTLSDVAFRFVPSQVLAAPGPTEIDTFMPGWGWLKRGIHWLCRRSHTINGLVAAIEMRLGRSELLSLPQYMSLCPTGQCNALCAFCSVTINRTGIIKKQLSLDLLNKFLAPVAKTISMYGLEGNGEPTLHSQFDGLVGRLAAGGAEVYLITNASRIRPDRVPLLMALNSINVSLNACTAETHRRVMKLKNFDEVVAAIKAIVRCRGIADGAESPASPRLSVSFVVTHDNIHEAQEFLRFAEHELGVDVILLRPLSELGNDLGTVEDLRDIVPFESDVRDLIDAVAEYRMDLNRRSEIRFAPETFRSVRPDPVDKVLMPRGCEDRLLAPRRADWRLEGDGHVSWRLAAATLTLSPGGVWRSVPIPVEPGRRLHFRATCTMRSGAVALAVRGEDGTVIAECTLSAGADGAEMALAVDTGAHEALALEWSSAAGASFEVDFGRVRTPAPLHPGDFRLPKPQRWETAAPNIEFSWSGARMTLGWTGPGGPYLVKSYTIPCRRHQRIEIPVRVAVAAGQLGIGVLTGDFSRWIVTEIFDTSHVPSAIVFDTADNDRIQIVLYAVSDPPLRAEITWPGLAAPTAAPLPAAPASEAVASPESEGQGATADPVVPAAPAIPPTRNPAFRQRARRIAQQWLYGRPRVYCHKPWTDLHNFTVDGRMDVCCIATGASQERYQLGNLNTQSFQEVWNGPVAQEFRRTVNGAKPLPPCQRCPMSHAYQGLWFDPVYTGSELVGRLGDLAGGRRTITGRIAMRVLGPPLRLVLRHVVFRGFRRAGSEDAPF